MKNIFLLIVSFFTAVSSFAQKAPSHQQWDKLLKKHVNEAGMVNYKGFQKDKTEFDAYLKTLSDNAPQKSWSQKDQIAYWINAYNAFTVKLIADNYPVKSIKDLGAENPIIFVNTAWDKKFFSIDGKKMTLNTIEHKILRKQFNDPRMHFAINCASYSCPKLLDEAYEGKTVNKQLDEQSKDFLADKEKNKISADKPQVSSLFKWFSNDFTKTGKTKIAFINQFTTTKIKESATLEYLDYSWDLNEQK